MKLIFRKSDGGAVEFEKFNPYHDRRGRFTSANAAASFTYSPGKSKAHDEAIARAKDEHKEDERKEKKKRGMERWKAEHEKKEKANEKRRNTRERNKLKRRIQRFVDSRDNGQLSFDDFNNDDNDYLPF